MLSRTSEWEGWGWGRLRHTPLPRWLSPNLDPRENEMSPPLGSAVAWSTSSLGFSERWAGGLPGVPGRQPDSPVGVASLDPPQPGIPRAVPPTHGVGLGGVRFAPAVYSTVTSYNSVTAALLLAEGSYSMLGGLGSWPPGAKDATFSPMLSKEASCLQPHLGFEKETLDLDDGPGETEAQGCCEFTKIT